jgi:transcriptional regulator with XRE-family HTH domain
MTAMAEADPEEVRQAFGARLGLARMLVFRTRAELARATDLKPNTLRTYEEGRNFPHVFVLKRLCDALGVTADWLFWGDPRGLDPEKRRQLEEDDASDR